ncbi:MAG: rRNA adenine N-6-methyltransferase family protein [Bacteroidota bacterium]
MHPLLSEIIDAYPDLKYALLEAQTFDAGHFGFPELYYKIMETDQVRINAFRRAFQHYNNFAGQVVCEVGVGRLALTKLFLPHVKKAYLIESNPHLFDFLEAEIDQNGWQERVVLFKADALNIQLPEPVDYLIGENMSIYCANELQVPLFQHLRQFLRPGGKLIPEKIINLVQLGDTSFTPPRRHYPIFLTRHLPTLLTSQATVNTIDLYQATTEALTLTVEVEALLEGTINCAFLHSWVQCAPGANFTGTDSLMPPTVVQLREPVTVKAGEHLRLTICYTYGTSLDEAVFFVTKSL